jgi:hypothetical protein
MRETLAFDAHRKSRTSGGLKVDALVPQVFWNATAPQHLRALGDPRSNIARMRAPHTQVCPVPMNAANAAPFTARSRSMSSKRMAAPLPPSSSVASAKVCAATNRCRARGARYHLHAVHNVHHADRDTGLRQPVRRAARAVSGICSDALMTTLLPVASAGARLFDRIINGWLNDVINARTPSGTRSV